MSRAGTLAPGHLVDLRIRGRRFADGVVFVDYAVVARRVVVRSWLRVIQ